MQIQINLSGDAILITATKNGTDVQVKEIRPRSAQFIQAIVTQWDGCAGRMRNICGNEDASFGIFDCESNYMPHVNDTVYAEILENNSISALIKFAFNNFILY